MTDTLLGQHGEHGQLLRINGGVAGQQHISDQNLMWARISRSTSTPGVIMEDAKKLLEILDEVKANGYACDNEEAERGRTCFARPLLDTGGHAYAAVSASGPTSRMLEEKDNHLKRLEELTAALAAKIA